MRRLGYLLDRASHVRQANALELYARKAKTTVPLEPSVKPLIASLANPHEKSNELRDAGDHVAAHKILMELCRAEEA